MAIAYVNSGTQASAGNPASPITFSYTIDAATKMLVFCAQTNNNTVTGDQLTSVTYGGTAMTIYKNTVDAYGCLYLCLLPNPATGANNFVVTFTNAGDTGWQGGFDVGEYSGTSATIPPDSNTTGSASATSLTTTTTTVADNCWLIEAGAAFVAVTAGTGTVKRQQVNTTGVALLDSNGVTTPAGSDSLIFSRSGSGNLKSVLVSIAPLVITTSLKDIIGCGIIPFAR